jgi:hypothetical protein
MHSPSRYIPGCSVRYIPPTDTKGSRWAATISRGAGAVNRYRATVPYANGPDAAAQAVVSRFNEIMGSDWVILGSALSIDGGSTYAYPVGPAAAPAAA